MWVPSQCLNLWVPSQLLNSLSSSPAWKPVLCHCLSWMGTKVGAVGCNVLAGALPGFRGGYSVGKQSHGQQLGIHYTQWILCPENFQVPQIENRWKFKLWYMVSSSKLLWSHSLQLLILLWFSSCPRSQTGENPPTGAFALSEKLLFPQSYTGQILQPMCSPDTLSHLSYADGFDEEPPLLEGENKTMDDVCGSWGCLYFSLPDSGSH